MSTTIRNYTIDTVRLIASFFVVVLHVNLTILDEDVVAAIMLSCRWAVPFFFIVSGYFFQSRFERDPKTSIKKNCIRLLKIFLLATIIYWPVAYLRTGELLKLYYLYNGTFFHLWFLSSMIGGFIFLYFIFWLRLSYNVILVFCLLILAFVLFKDSYANVFTSSHKHTTFYSHHRWPLSIPFLFIGMYFRKNADKLYSYLNWQIGAGLVIAGFLLQLHEARFLKYLTQYPPDRHEFLIGTLLFAVGAFIISLTITSAKSKFSDWGESYSLLIYLYHPLVDALVATLLNYYAVVISFPFVYPPVVFVLTLSLVIIINRYFPTLFSFLSGSHSFLNKKRFFRLTVK